MGARVAVLASGKGSNLQALLDDPAVRPWIGLVVSDRPGIQALDRAEEAGVRSVVVDWNAYPDREAFGGAILDVLQKEGIDHIVLAGFMRILSPEIVRAYRGRMLNIHPALLPRFGGPGMYGRRVHEAVLASGDRESGATVHLVDEEVDHGPIVLQEAVPVLPDDDEESLQARIQDVEHRLYPRAVQLLVEGKLKVEGRIVHVEEDS